MEQIIVAILVMIVSGIFAAVKERAQKKRAAAPIVPDFLSSEAKPAKKVPAPPAFPLPEEGVRVTAATPAVPEVPEADLDERRLAEQLEAHRERWRRAIIDSEIITPKF